ncbi:uncharacterized protein HGUI_03313 [Hanseniaspora guilliermondii]|uniref:PPIase cyclophilin-type domain-containing protein n=1 Tax=Hanseniaspora guilliermondii TaxID=56406 RepID=A0A1L0CRD1_9ASCO|nr:uncharacterized protein HGUI_03313 [Hanseniaspora guilliermondii]
MVCLTKIIITSLLSFVALSSGAALKLKDSLKPQTYEINPPVNDLAFMVVEYFDVDTQSYKQFDISIELFSGLLPKTVKNFHQLSNGVKALLPNYKSKDEAVTIGYKNTTVETFEVDKYVQFGDVLPDVGPFSIYGYKFDDESFQVQFDRPGRVAMANYGADTNACQFFITTDTMHSLDNSYVAFGQVVEGLDTIIEKLQYLKDVTLPEGFDYKAKIIYSFCTSLHHDRILEATEEYLTLVDEYRKGNVNEENSMVFDPMLRSKFYEEHMDLLENTQKVVSSKNPHKVHSSQGKPNAKGPTNPVELLAVIVCKLLIIFSVGFGMNFVYNKYKYKILSKLGSGSKNSGDYKVVGLRHE